jgi:hypothetical protein
MNIHIIELATETNVPKLSHIVCECGYSLLYAMLSDANYIADTHRRNKHAGDGLILTVNQT